MPEDFSNDREPVEELAEEFLLRRRRGETPSLQEYIDRHPDLAGEIRDVFPALLMLEEVDPRSQDLSRSPVESGLMQGAERIDQLGDYRILREVGRGGMGIVYEAEQLSLGRRVALKVLARQMLQEAKHKLRFEREARAAARLHHTNIVPVFGIGEQMGVNYYVMQFIQGLGLDQVIDELKRMLAADSEGSRALPAGELRVGPREELTAVEVARSLVMGEFLQPLSNDQACDSERTAVRADGNAKTLVAPGLECKATSVAGRLSDTFAVAPSSAALPGQRDAAEGSHTGRKGTYWHSVAHIGRQVAEALQHAHGQGVLHRDIKPSNLLLDLHGTVWITDFGLAKAADEHELTVTGDLLGTLRYIPPEAFSGVIDARSDVYSLGLTLYELLALRPAFEEKDRHRLVKLLTTSEPERIDKLNRDVPRDLATIVHKTIDREPTHRYQTARELADDLQRFLDDDAIKARPVTAIERFARWSRRNRQLAWALAGIGILLAVGVLAASIAATKFRGDARRMTDLANQRENERRKAVEARNDAVAAHERERELRQREVELRQRETELRRQAETAGILANERAATVRHNLYLAEMGAARQAWQEMNGSRRVHWLLDKWRWQAGEDAPGDLRGWEWYYLESRFRRALVSLTDAWGSVLAAAYSPDGRRFAIGTRRLGIEVRDAATGRLFMSLRADQVPVRCVGWSPDGKFLATGADDARVQLWDVASGRQIAAMNGHSTLVSSVEFSPDGRQLLSASFDGTVRIWDATEHREIAVLRGHPGGVGTARWNPAGTRIASASDDGTICIWDPQTAAELLRWRDLIWRSRLCWSPDGRQLATTSSDELSCKLWDAESGHEIRRFRGHSGEVCAVAFAPDGKRLVSSGIDGLVQIWDVETGQALRAFRGHTVTVNCACWSPDGTHLLSAGDDAVVSIWDVERDLEFIALRGHTGYLKCLAWSPDGRMLASGGNDETLRLWDVATARETAALPCGGGFVNTVSWNPRRPQIATGSTDGRIRIWDEPSGSLLITLEEKAGQVLTLDWDRDGERLTAGYSDGSIRICAPFDAARQPVVLRGHRAGVVSVRYSPDGRWLASGSGDATAKLWDVAAASEMATFVGHKYNVDGVSWSPDGARLASCSWDGTLKIWDVASRSETMTLKGHAANLYSVAWSPDGTRLASCGMDRQVKLWDVASGQEAFSLETHANQVIDLAWSPDGMQLATASFDRTIHILDATPALEREGSTPLLAALDLRLAAHPDDARDYQLRAAACARMGRLDRAEIDSKRAIRNYKRLIEKGPDTDRNAREFASFLLQKTVDQVQWRPVEVVRSSSAGGATLTSDPDKCILVSGARPVDDQYEVVVDVPRGTATGLRIEALPDPSLPNSGPGRDVAGNFVLTQIVVSTITPAGGERSGELAFRSVWTDFTQRGFRAGRLTARPPHNALGWAVSPLVGQAHTAIFEFERPVEFGPDVRLAVLLDFGSQTVEGSSLGRFRISVTSAPQPARLLRLNDQLAHSGTRGWPRLAAIQALAGNHSAARAALEHSAAAIADPVAEELFLLAMAAAEVDRPEVADRYLARGLKSLADNPLDMTLVELARDTVVHVRHLDDRAADEQLPKPQDP